MRIVRLVLVLAAAALVASAVALAVQGPGSPGADEQRATVSGTLAADGRGWRLGEGSSGWARRGGARRRSSPTTTATARSRRSPRS